jgi:hypothetical protein
VRVIATEIDGGFQISAVGGNPGAFGPAFTNRRGHDGIIRLETFKLSAGFSQLNGRVFSSLPGLVFADGTGLGTVRISQVGGATVPVDAGSNTALPDVIIPSGVSNPVTVQVTATNVTPGQPATIRLNFQGAGGQVIEATTTPLSGTNEMSTATASITMPAGSGTMTAVLTTPISSRGNGAIQIADGAEGRILIDGEPAVSVERETVLGGATTVTYVTESGKRWSASEP